MKEKNVNSTTALLTAAEDREMKTFLLSAVLFSSTILFVHNTDYFWYEIDQPNVIMDIYDLIQALLIQLIIPISVQVLTVIYIHWKRGPLNIAEQKVQNILIPTARFNILITLPLTRILALCFGVYFNVNNTLVLNKLIRVILIEMLHHMLHSLFHVKHWFGYKYHQQHHIKDYSLPLSAIGNHPFDLFVTVFGPPAIIGVYSNGSYNEQLIVLCFLAHVGTLVHSDSHYFWFLDIHGIHHSDGRYNLNGYIPITDILIGTFKKAQRYTKPYGWR